MTTPRVFIIRHGETEWSLDGRHTGVSDIPLTTNGERRIRATGRALVGEDRLIVPRNLAHVYVSPRKRAQRTVELLNLGCAQPLPWSGSHPEDHDEVGARSEARVEVTESVREWDYGDYEGVTSATIREQRKEKGEAEWDIWRDGCPGGEYVRCQLPLWHTTVPNVQQTTNIQSPDPPPTSPPAATPLSPTSAAASTPTQLASPKAASRSPSMCW
jgi:broad specificity phosphatase PhoE